MFPCSNLSNQYLYFDCHTSFPNKITQIQHTHFSFDFNSNFSKFTIQIFIYYRNQTMEHCVTHSCKKPQICKCRFMRHSTIPVIWLLGGVGSGKKTLGSALAQKFNMNFISCGDMLREVATSRSERAGEITKKLLAGELVDDLVIIELLEGRIKNLYKSTQGFILSCIKNTNQATMFEKYIAQVDLIMYLECSEEIMLQRANERLQAQPELDDTPETFVRRIELFNATIQGLLKQYKSKIKTIDAETDRDTILSFGVQYVTKARAVKLGDEARSNPVTDDEMEAEAVPEPEPEQKEPEQNPIP